MPRGQVARNSGNGIDARYGFERLCINSRKPVACAPTALSAGTPGGAMTAIEIESAQHVYSPAQEH
jgi:hypothetical protein